MSELPESVDLTAAAHCLIEAWTMAEGCLPYSRDALAYTAMERLWRDLTGTEDTPTALALAYAITGASHDVHAHVPPL